MRPIGFRGTDSRVTSTESFVYTYTVTKADVIWVVGQIRAELEQFQFLYPDFIETSYVENFTRALGVFLSNDVISEAKMIIGWDAGGKNYTCDDQRVFRFDHEARPGRGAFEEPILERKLITPGAAAHSFMTFNHNIINKPRADQRLLLAGTSWSGCVPGAGTASITYANEVRATGHSWSRNLGVTRWQ